MVDVAGGSDDDVARMVRAPVQPSQVINRETPDRLPSAQDRVAVGVRRPQRSRVELEDQVVGRVVHRRDLLENDLALELEIVRAEDGMAHDVGQNVECPCQIVVHSRAVKASSAPPRPSSSSGRSRAERRSVPLNTICSRR